MQTINLKTPMARAAALIAAGVLSALPGLATAGELGLATLSTRADMVSGGDVVVRASVPADVALADIVVRLNGADVTDRFVADSASHSLSGLLVGLQPSDNRVVATVRRQRGGGAPAHRPALLRITNHAGHGPVFSGPRQTPWVCETEASGLGAPPTSGPCSAPVRYDWFYRTTAGSFAPLPGAGAPYPADLARTTTIDGHVVDYIVRVESGVINESIYRIAILDDPADPVREPWSQSGKKPGAGWNGKLSYPYGGGASPGYRSGSNTVQSALQDSPLNLGFAVAFGTRNTYATGADDVISAETTMMIKERFIEQYGLPRFTISSGASGGSMQQHYIAQNYPGLLDALTPSASYPDLASIAIDVLDCVLINNYFDHIANPDDWPGSRRAEVDGYSVGTPDSGRPGHTICQDDWGGFGNGWQNAKGDGPTGFSPVVPVASRYDPVTNPSGARGTYWDGNVNSFGKDPATGFARSPYDNIGVQYGLIAVNRGAITPEEFVHLNERAGGLDVDGNITAERTAGDMTAIKRAYRSGRIIHSFENVRMPIIDVRPYIELPTPDIHSRERSLMYLERMQRSNGTTANQVNWTFRGNGLEDFAAFERMALLANNQWLENIAADSSDTPYAAKVIQNKPADLKDACWVGDQKIEEPVSWDPATACNQAIPVFKNVRLMSGGPLTGDVFKCSLKRLDFGDYGVAFSAAQQQRLRAVFPQGVCDWTKSGQGRRALAGPWLDFGKGVWGPANLYND